MNEEIHALEANESWSGPFTTCKHCIGCRWVNWTIYRCLIQRLVYLMISRPDICFIEHSLSSCNNIFLLIWMLFTTCYNI